MPVAPQFTMNRDGSVTINTFGNAVLLTTDGTTPDAGVTPSVGTAYPAGATVRLSLPAGKTTTVKARCIATSAATSGAAPVLTQSSVAINAYTIPAFVAPTPAAAATPNETGSTALSAALRTALTQYISAGAIGNLIAGNFGNVRADGGGRYTVFARGNRKVAAVVTANDLPDGSLVVTKIEYR